MTGEYGVEQVRANIEPENGELSGGQVASTGDNQWRRFTTTATRIEGLVVKALSGNSGTVYVAGPAGAPGVIPTSYPLEPGETVSIGINDLSKIYLFFTANGDSAAYLAITDTGR